MGYYSDVRVATTKRGYDMLKDLVQVMLAKEALAGKEVYNLLDHLDVARYNSKADYVIFGWDVIKWYEDESNVLCIVKALQRISTEEPMRFVRVGEAYDDIEMWDTDYDSVLPGIYPIAHIEIDGNDEYNEIDLKMQEFVESATSSTTPQ